MPLVCGRGGEWHTTEAVDVLQPILSKLLIDYTVTTRGVIETMLISDNANVCQTAEEHEGAKLELLLYGRRSETNKQVPSAHSFKVDSRRLKNTPDKS